jgi:hypothetical protein
MATRFLGPTGSRRRRRFLVAPLFLLTLVALFGVTGAQAVHDDNLFELGPSGSAPFTATTATNIEGDGLFANGPDWKDLFTTTGALKDVIGQEVRREPRHRRLPRLRRIGRGAQGLRRPGELPRCD